MVVVVCFSTAKVISIYIIAFYLLNHVLFYLFHTKQKLQETKTIEIENKKRNDCLLLYEKDCVSLQKIYLKQKNNPSKSLTL